MAPTPATDGHLSLAPAREQFAAPIAAIEFGNGGGDGPATLRGHAAVFDRLSHDLGGFRTRIAPGAFDAVLDGNPDVHLLWDHDTRYTLARTRSQTLDLRADPRGLHVYAQLAPTTYAADLVALMRRGDVDQMSFACLIGQDTWAENADGDVTRTIETVDELYDVTVCAQGAFPQTDSRLVTAARDAGRIQPFVRPDDAEAAGRPGVAVTRRRARARLARHTHPLPY